VFKLGNIQSYISYSSKSVKKYGVDNDLLIPFWNSSFILSWDIPSKDESLFSEAIIWLSNSDPVIPANRNALSILNLSSLNLSLGSPTDLTTPFSKSSIPPTKSIISLVSVS